MSPQPFRMAEGGRVDRAVTLDFQFDGETYSGHPGDTLASALLANGAHLVGRSFKYHRPRGILSAGAEEPNALVHLRGGSRGEPNVRATQAELYDGLVAESQNRWPGLRFDAGAVNDLLSPLFPAGFYYKTFMWPASLWMTYEHAIRRMAGLGRAPDDVDPDFYEKVYAHCDILVVGGGPAGLAAAVSAARSGARVILADERIEFGGNLLGNDELIDGAPGMDWVAKALTELADEAEVRLLPRTQVAGYYDHNFLTLVERVADHLAEPASTQPRQRVWKVRAAQVVLATGAIERPLVFANNDRPGVMLAGAAQTYANRFGVRAGRRAVVVTNNDHAYRAAMDLAAAGVRIAEIVDLRPDGAGEWGERARARGIVTSIGEAVVDVHGRSRVRAVEVARLNEAGDGVVGGSRRIECDLVCMSGGWNPTLHLFSQSGGTLHFDPSRGCLLPDQARQAMRVVGAANGAFELATCLQGGWEAGAAAAVDAGHTRRRRGSRQPTGDLPLAEVAARQLWLLPTRTGKAGRAKRFVDFQNDVTAADLALAAREGYRSIEHVKRYTTTGMGTDQGKTSNVNALSIVAATLGQEPSSVGTTTFRPPYTPVSFGALTGGDRDQLFDPVRKTPMHQWHQSNGALFEPVGQWLRPFYYPRNGEDKHGAVMRESQAARQSIGLMDASTLGKIDIQGRDAAEFLNRIYTNAWDRLGVGRCRYGLMLHEDGMVFDDGVTARLGDHHFHMTTTTGNAGTVLSWMEDWRQCEWPDLQVYMTSTTEHWAVASLCGPNSRALMEEVSRDIDLSADAFPFMSFRDGSVAGLPARVFRVSFTGELSYEINVPARYGLALWQALMTSGEKYGITPFGTEAMHLLRAEVGFIIVGQETDGTVTPIDLGMEWAVSPRKDFLGKRSLARSDTARADRRQLVGLLSEDPMLVVPEGAQLVMQENPVPPTRMIGHVTSSYFSPNCERSIALALLERGGERHGEKVYIAFDGQTVPARVGPPKFFDMDGSRARG